MMINCHHRPVPNSPCRRVEDTDNLFQDIDFNLSESNEVMDVLFCSRNLAFDCPVELRTRQKRGKGNKV